MKLPKQALITGALGGLAAATIELLTKNDWHIFALDMKDELISDYAKLKSVTPLKVDITKEQSVFEAFKKISGDTNGLDAIINMAGVLKIGSMAELPLSDLEEVLRVNLLAAYRINKQFLPLLLERKGRIINLSSEVGRQTAAPFNGAYAISKHALEAYSDALRRELSLLGLKVIKIQPGPFKTNMTRRAEHYFIEAKEHSAHFKKNLEKGNRYLPRVYKNAHDPHLVAKTIHRALSVKNPKTAYRIKTDKLRHTIDLLPVKWSDWVIKKALS